MILGAAIGAFIGIAFYIVRANSRLLLQDAQQGVGAVTIQAGLHALTPSAIGALVGWALA